jgi:hypothetical protein
MTYDTNTGTYGSGTDYADGGNADGGYADGIDGGGLKEMYASVGSLDKKWWIGFTVVATVIAIVMIVLVIVFFTSGASQAQEALTTRIPMLKKRISSQAVDQKLYDSMIGL